MAPIREMNHLGTSRSSALALFALVSGALAIGLAPILVRLSLADVDPASIGFWRTTLALPFFLMWMRIGNLHSKEILSSAKKAIAIAGLMFALDLIAWHWALKFTSVASATLLSNLTPILVAISSVFIFGERFNKKFWTGLLLAVIGAGLLASTGFNQGHLRGDALAVVTAFFYSGYLLAIGRLRKNLDTAPLMFWTTVVSALVLGIYALLFESHIIPSTAKSWLNVFALALVCQFIGQGLIAFAFAHLPAAFGAVTLLVQPAVAAAVAWLLFNETLTFGDLAGAMAIFLGILLARQGTTQKTD